jgi:hypothetical protein
MKRKFTLLIAALALLTMIVQPGRAWGQTKGTETVSYGWETTDDATPWTISDAIVATSGQGNHGDYAGKISTNSTIVQFNDKVYVTSFSYAFKRTSNNNNYSVYIETSDDGSTWSIVDTQAMNTFTNGSYRTVTKEFDGTTELYVRFRCNNTTAIRYVDDVTITYATSASQLEPNDLTLLNTSTSLVFDLYNNAEPQVIHYTTSSTGEVSVVDNNYITAEVNQDNKTITVTPVAVTNGARVITVNQAADDTYASGSKTFTVIITDSTPTTGSDVTFDATTDQGDGSITKDGITFTCDSGILNNGTEYRLYKNSTTTFSIESGTITQIVFNCTSGNPASGFETQTGWTTDGNNGTWTGSATSVSFVASNKQVRATTIVVTVDNGGTPAPSITADNVSIEYNATSGSITYTINNGVEGGNLSAATDSDWLTLPETFASPIEFTCLANEAATERTATVVLTYAYGDSQTVNKNVTVTQAGDPNVTPTIAEVRAQGTGNVVTRGIVTSCVGTTGYIQDATAAICVYGAELTVGDEIRVSGTLSNYNGLLEITSPTVTVISQGNTTEPELMTIAEIVTSTNQGWYVRIEEATVTEISGQNTTIAQGDNTIVVRGITGVEYAVNDVLSLNGNIGCYNTTQIANPQNVEVQDAPAEPSVTVTPNVINAPAEGDEGTLALAYENITEFITFDFYFCDAEGEALQENPDWIDAEIQGNETYSLYYLIDANDGEARTTYIKVYTFDDDAEEVYDIVTVNQAEYVAPTYAELPFEFDGGRADIEGTDGLSQENLGTDYSSSPKLKFEKGNKDDDGLYSTLVLQFNERPGTLTFDIKGNSFSDGTFTVQTSEDGVTYTDLETYTELGNTQSEEFTNLGENVRYIKWIYTEKVNGNVALGNIKLAEYEAPVASITVDPDEVSVDAGEHDGTLGLTYENLTITDMSDFAIQYYDAEGKETDEPDWAEVVVAEQDPEMGEGYVVSYYMMENEGEARTTYFKVYAMGDNTELVYSNLVTISQAAQASEVYAISFYVNGEEDAELAANVPAGESITLPTASTYTPAGFVIVGWSTSNNSTVAVENPYTPTGSCNLYAIMQMNNGYEKVTENLNDWSGEYLIVYEDGNVAFDGSRETLDAAQNTIAVTIANNTIGANATTNASMFTIAAISEDVYSIQSASGYYIGRTNDANGLDSSTETVYANSISYDNGVNIISSGGAYLRYNSNSGQERFRYFKSSTYSSQKAIQLYKKTDASPATYNTIVNVTEETIIDEDIAETELVLVASGAVLTFNGQNNGSAANLIIEDGGQLVFSGDDVQATVKKQTIGGTKADMHWYTIASPVANNKFTEVDNLMIADPYVYDLYRYNETTSTWENYKEDDPAHAGFNPGDANSAFEAGRGYLYYNEAGSELSFAGTLNNDGVKYNLTAGSSEFTGINLIGNPFTQDITLANIEGEISEGGYVLNNANDWSADPNLTIKPCEGFLVQVATPQEITINKTTSSKSRANHDYIALTVTNNEYEDVAYALFSNGMGLNKINHRNADIPMIYIPQDGKNYAIATMSDNTEMFNLNFKAMTTGKYTLSYKAKGTYSYLHVIDRFTGEDIDMLVEGEYSFIGSSYDNDARFIVKLSYNANIGEFDTNSIFAYQNGDEIIVNGEGQLQVYDVMGRFVQCINVNGTESISASQFSDAVYIFRMIGETVKTQKIVVR